MALTRQGDRLTAAHKEAQIELGAAAAALTVDAARILDPLDLDRTGPAWLARQTAILELCRARSVALARAYLVAFRAVEGIEPEPIELPDLPTPAEVLGWVLPTIKARSAGRGSIPRRRVGARPSTRT